jgi:hypothetical protein
LIEPLQQPFGGSPELPAQFDAGAEAPPPPAYPKHSSRPPLGELLAPEQQNRIVASYSSELSPILSPTNARLLEFFTRWLNEPDDKGEEWWSSFDAELMASRHFEEREIE